MAVPIDWTLEQLPKPTAEIGQAISDIEQWGCAFLKATVPEPLLSECRDRLVEQAKAKKARNIAFEDGGPDQQWKF